MCVCVCLYVKLIIHSKWLYICVCVCIYVNAENINAK